MIYLIISDNDKNQIDAMLCDHLKQVLTVLHDPKRLRIFSHEEKCSMVKSYILNRLLTPEPEMDIMKAKQFILQGEENMSYNFVYCIYKR